MNIIEKRIDELIMYENNPKIHTDEQIDKIAKSIELTKGLRQPIVIDKNNVIVVGHGRVQAAMQLGLETVPCELADDLTDEEIRAYRLIDNELAKGDSDLDLLEQELASFNDIDMGEFFDDEEIWGVNRDENTNNQEHISLNDRFIVPPFSVLDTRQGYWQNRKKQWIGIGIESEKGRGDNIADSPDLPTYANNGTLRMAVGTSIFDPVLCEIMYKWFNVDGGVIYDCFAGGSVRGIIAEILGYKYKGIDLRQEQISENKRQAAEIGVSPEWFCDDSLNADKYIDDNTADMVFTCPPYADLEVYSDDKRDISNMPYDDFCKVYSQILSIACRKLKSDRFAVIVIGDVRDKKGAYRQLVDYTRKVLTDNGLILYNDFVLVEQVGTGAIRAPKQFNAQRKAVKVHQNVLVFYKGDIRKIKDNYQELNLTEKDLSAEITE